MVSNPQLRSPAIAESKINQKSLILHPLARFVNEETVALLFNLSPEQIYRIDCFRYVVYVHGKGVSKFVSYADFPPIVGTMSPTGADFVLWHKRWRKRWKSKQAPAFWINFYAYQFKKAPSVAKLRGWGELVAVVKSEFSEVQLQELRKIYVQEKNLWDQF